MKLALLVSSLNSGGAERVATTLCNAWVARGDSVTLIPTFSGGGVPFYPLDAGVELLYLAQRVGVAPTAGKRHLARLAALRHLLVERRPDVVLSFLPNVNIAALMATACTGLPCVVGERSDPTRQPLGAAWRLACKLLYRAADRVTVQTHAVAATIGQVYGGLKDVVVVPNPLPDELLAWRAVGSAGARRTLLSLGRLSEEKRVDRIIDAFAALAVRFPEWDLHIHGDGPLRGALQRQIDALGMGSRIQLAGRSSEPWRVMAGADAFVMASRYEGFPNALLEAMGVGLACVATDCHSGPREITRDGTDALLVGTDDAAALREAMARLMGDAGLRRELGQRARDSVASRYALDTVLKAWDGVFRSLGAPV